jgi:hypothetical protein
MGKVFGVVVVLLIALAAMTQLVGLRRAPVQVISLDGEQWVINPPDLSMLRIQTTEERATPTSRPDRSRKKLWWKPEQAPPAEAGPPWRGVIERSCVVGLADSRKEIVDAIRDGLHRELRLSQAPSPQFVANPAMVRITELSRETLKNSDSDIGEVAQIRYEVELTTAGWQELGHDQRAERSEERMEIAARGLGLLTVLLGLVAGFIRLDEWTKGYYSGRLFLAATAIGAVAGVLILRPM